MINSLLTQRKNQAKRELNKKLRQELGNVLFKQAGVEKTVDAVIDSLYEDVISLAMQDKKLQVLKQAPQQMATSFKSLYSRMISEDEDEEY